MQVVCQGKVSYLLRELKEESPRSGILRAKAGRWGCEQEENPKNQEFDFRFALRH
jgi:hypothetical protein